MAQPTHKAPVIAALLENLTSRSTSIAADRCIPKPIGCDGPATTFRDALSAREYQISGMCQNCQDTVFGTGKD